METMVQTLHPSQTFREPVNGLTHFIGAVLACIGLILLIFKAIDPFRTWHLIAYCVYGTGMILLYSISTLFHWARLSDVETSRLRKLDHIMIFIFMATTYTPFCIIPFRGTFGWSMLGSMWVITILGSLFKIYCIQTPKWLCTTIYLCAGWFALVGFGPVVRTLQPEAVFWLLAGGVLYSTGAVVYASNWPDPLPDIFGSHEIFHLFVMLGSGSHFWVVYRYITMFS